MIIIILLNVVCIIATSCHIAITDTNNLHLLTPTICLLLVQLLG